jgi:hypothetical protein
MEASRTVIDIIDAVGVGSLARSLGHENLSTVSSWKSRGSIPAGYWRHIVAFAASTGVEGVTYEALVDAHTKNPDRSSENAA